jgi:glycosyltransferase involved in cell wall biosynthesis
MNKVVQIQYSEDSAGRAALRLHKAFLEAKIDCSVLYLKHPGTISQGVHSMGKIANKVAEIDLRLQKSIRKNVAPAYGLYSYPILGTDISKLPQIKEADFIILHWVLHGFLNIRNMERLIKLGKPVIFFMHDMWTITGGCHYSLDCSKYKTECRQCPAFVRHQGKDYALSEFEKKLKLFSAYRNVYFVSPSRWLFNCIKESALAKDKPAFHIPNVLDRTIFKPFDKRTAKQILNIPQDQTVIAFGAMSVNSPYKGWGYLKNALEILKGNTGQKNLSVLVFGSSYNDQIADSIPFEVKFMGTLKDEYSSALVYNAADVFVAPSLADNLPYTIFEALSCGTPVVAFNTGGIPDMIQHKTNGYLAKYKDAQDIADGIHFVLDNGIKGHLSEEYETSNTVRRHQQLFDQIRNKTI